QGETEAVAEHAEAAAETFRIRIKAKSDDHEARFGLIECLLLQAKFADAKQLITESASLTTAGEFTRSYSRQLSHLTIEWYDAKEKERKLTAGERLEMLESAFNADSDNAEVFNRILKLMNEKTPEAEKAHRLLRTMATEKKSYLAHFFLGLDAWQKD